MEPWPGSAYVEVRVVRTGRTMPMLGFGLMEALENIPVVYHHCFLDMGVSINGFNIEG